MSARLCDDGNAQPDADGRRSCPTIANRCVARDAPPAGNAADEGSTLKRSNGCRERDWEWFDLLRGRWFCCMFPQVPLRVTQRLSLWNGSTVLHVCVICRYVSRPPDCMVMGNAANDGSTLFGVVGLCGMFPQVPLRATQRLPLWNGSTVLSVRVMHWYVALCVPGMCRNIIF